MKILLISLSIFCSLLLPTFNANGSNLSGADDAIPNTGKIMKNESSEEKGKKLRTQLDLELNGVPQSQLKEKNKIISKIVSQYLVVGMSFPDAQAILRAAGLRVTKRENIIHHTRLDYRDDVVGFLDLPSKTFSKSELIITLSPKEIGDYTNVEKINSGISTVVL